MNSVDVLLTFLQITALNKVLGIPHLKAVSRVARFSRLQEVVRLFEVV